AGHADRFHPRPHYDSRPDSAGRNGKSKRGCAINIACPARSEYRSGAVDQQGGHRVAHYTDCNECASGPGGAQDPCPAVRAQHPRCSHQQRGSTEEVAGGADQASGAFDPNHGTRNRDAIGSRHGGRRYFHCIQDAEGLIRAERRAERCGPGRVMKPAPMGRPARRRSAGHKPVRRRVVAKDSRDRFRHAATDHQFCEDAHDHSALDSPNPHRRHGD
ncbi:MAG: hypothetical protein JWM13_1179, partial [Arthrobacter sp.]|nr:hypothetical protein [Arthrobacter sp.]